MATATATSTTAMAALPAAGGARPRSLLATGTALVCAGATTFMGALFAAALELRNQADVWPPKNVKIDNYLGNMLVITMLLSSLSAAWAVSAVKRSERRQGAAAFGITIGFGVAMLNLLWYSLARQHLALNSSAYAGVVGAICGVLAALVLVGIGVVALTIFRVMGEQVNGAQPDQARAAAWLWHYATFATIVAWFAVIVLK
jgi:heme/copper-type cytochrome/quinol oxidase subunit 3